MVNRAADAAEPDDGVATSSASRTPARSATAAPPGSSGAAGSRSATTTRSTSSAAANVIVAVGAISKVPPAARASTAIDVVDEPRGDARPGAAEEPARPRRRPDRLRAGPGLRPVRRPDDDRPVRRPARCRPTIPATPRRSPRRSGAIGRRRPARRPGDRGPGRRRHGRRPRDRPRRRHDGRGPRDPARRRAGVPARRPGPRALRHRHDAAAPASRATAGCGSPTGCGSIGDPAGPELHTHQAHYQGEIAVRMALGDDVTPDYRALPRATYTDPEAAFVGLTLDQAKADGDRRVRARRRLRDVDARATPSRRRSAT